MTNFSFEQAVRSWKMLAVITAAFAVVGLNVALLLPVRYESAVSLIVIQKHDSEKIDAFSAARSAEYLGDILTRAVRTNAFMEDIMKAPGVRDTLNKIDPEERMNDWEKMVDARKVNNTGIINITVLNTSREQAQTIAKAIVWNFQNKGQAYHGGGDSVEIRLMDGPVTSIRPTVPSVPLYALFSGIVGLVMGIGWVVFVRGRSTVRRSVMEPVDFSAYAEKNKEILSKENGHF